MMTISSPVRRRCRALGPLVIFALAALVIYANTWASPFVLDDHRQILNNPYLKTNPFTPAVWHSLWQGPSPPRPVAMWTFNLNYFLHGQQVFGYHLVNLVIHVLTALLVLAVAGRTLQLCGQRPGRIPMAAALVWLVHPLHTQSVTYIVQRMTALAALFFLLSLWCYIRGRQEMRPRWGSSAKVAGWFSGAFLAGLLALGSKPNAAVLPLVIGFYEWYFLSRQNHQPSGSPFKKTFWGALAGVAVLIMVVMYLGVSPVQAVLSGYEAQVFTPAQRLLTEPRVILYYLSLLVYPFYQRLHLDYDFPLSQALFDPGVTFLSIIALAALVVAVIATARRHRLLSFALLWFLLNLLIESSVLGLAIIFEQRTYLPSVFLVIAGCHWASRAIGGRFLRLAGILLLLIASGVWTHQRNAVWDDPQSIWQDCLQKAPANARAYHNLAYMAGQQGRFDRAVDYYQQALRIFRHQIDGPHPVLAQVWHNLGKTYYQAGQYRPARVSFRQALEAWPASVRPDSGQLAQIYNSRGLVASQQGDYEQAGEDFKNALRLHRQQPGANRFNLAATYNNLGNMHQQQGRHRRAADCFKKALQLFQQEPAATAHQLPLTYNNLGVALSLNGEYAPALFYLQQAVDLVQHRGGRQSAILGLSYKNMARVYADQGKYPAARRYYQKAGQVFYRALGPGHFYTRQVRRDLQQMDAGSYPARD